MATSSDRNVQKGKIAALKHDDAAVKSGSRLLFDDERRAAQYDGYSETESAPSGFGSPTSSKVLPKSALGRIGVGDAAAINKTAANARLDGLFALSEQGDAASSKSMAGAATFGNWAGMPSLVSSDNGYAPAGPMAAGLGVQGGDALKVQENLYAAPVLEDMNANAVAVASDEASGADEGDGPVIMTPFGLRINLDSTTPFEMRYGEAQVRLGTVSYASAIGAVSFEFYNESAGKYWIDENRVLWATDFDYFNYEKRTSTTIFLRATDSTGTAQTSANVTIRNIVEKAVNLTFTSNGVDENSANNTTVGTLSAFNPEHSSFIQWKIIGGNYNNAFAVDLTDPTGRVYVADKTKLDYEWGNYTLLVRAETVQGGSVVTTADSLFLVNVKNVNERPYGMNAWGLSVGEHKQAGQQFLLFEPLDQDRGETFQFFIDNDPSGKFHIDRTTGWVSLISGAKLDYETASQHTIQVRVVDSAFNELSSAYTIAVQDENDAPKGLVYAPNVMNEDASVGALVAAAPQVDDPDALESNRSFRFKLVNADNSPYTDNALVINEFTGEIRVGPGGLPPVDAATLIQISVRVTDQGGNGLSHIEHIFIRTEPTNQPPAAPVVQGEVATLTENVGGTISVATVQSTDDGVSGASLVYQLVSNPGGLFSINMNTGEISFAGGASGANYESSAVGLQVEDQGLPTERKYWEVKVRAVDGGSLASPETIVKVYLNDVNEVPDDLAYTPRPLYQNMSAGTEVAAAPVVSDPDTRQEYRDFRYKLVNADDSDYTGSEFAIDPATGRIIVGQGGLRNVSEPTQVQIRVKVTDKGGTGLSHIETLMITLNPPAANQPPSAPAVQADVTTLTENLGGTQLVATVQSTDDNNGGALRYELATNPGGLFSINESTGEISFAGGASGANYESSAIGLQVEDQGLPTERKYWEVKVRAVETSGGLASPESIVKVYLNDVNEAPSTVAYSPNVMDGSAEAGDVVAAAPAVSDPDTRTAFRDFRFKLVNEDDTDYTGNNFAINNLTGEITVGSGGLPGG